MLGRQLLKVSVSFSLCVVILIQSNLFINCVSPTLFTFHISLIIFYNFCSLNIFNRLDLIEN